MWMVWDKEDGLICTDDDYDACLKEYEKQKRIAKDYLSNEDGLSEDEIGYQVIIAKIEQSLSVFETPDGLSFDKFYDTKNKEVKE